MKDDSGSHHTTQRTSIFGGGHSGELLRTIDWSQHPLGSVELWPYELKSTLNTVLNSRQPMTIWWGRELFQFYNDAYRPSLGTDKHPKAMGQRVAETWPETLPSISEQIEFVFRESGSILNENHLVPVFRNGKLEEVYWTYSYSPIFDHQGVVAGILVVCVETTDKVISARALAESEARLNLALTSGNIGFWDWKPKTGETHLSQTLIADWGFDPSTPPRTLDDCLARIHPEDRDVVWGEIQKATHEDKPYDVTYRVLRPTGDVIWIKAKGRLFLDENSAPERLTGITVNISDQVEARNRLERNEAQLKAEQKKLEAIFYRTDAALVLFRGPDLVYEMINEKYQEIVHGRDVLGKPLLEALPEIVNSPFPEIIRDVYETGKTCLLSEGLTPLLNQDSGILEERYFDTSFARITDDPNQPYLIIGHAADVTDRVRARHRLEVALEDVKREAERADRELAKLEAALQAISDGVFIFDSNGQPVYMNEGAAKIFGAGSADDVTRPFEYYFERLDLYELDGTLIPLEKWPVARALGGDSFKNWQIQAHRRDIDRRWIWSASGELVIQPGSDVTLAIVGLRDITEDKRNSLQLEAAKREAERANESKSAFLANMSHEIRTPLGAIIGFTDIVKSSDLDAEEREHYLNVVNRNGQALLKIIDDILDLSKIEAGKLDIEKSSLCLKELIRDVIHMFSDRLQDKGVELEFSHVDLPDFRIYSDASRIRQVLVNLIGNAVKFTSHGSISVSGRFKIIGTETVQITILVSDTGIGMTQDQAKKLFVPFTQADNTSARKYGGTGLGLALSKRLGTALGGDVVIESTEEGRGSCFRFDITATKSTSSPVNNDSATTAGDSRHLRLNGTRVLVIDDSADNRTLIELYLQREGAIVTQAFDGESGIDKALSETPDIVLMDIQMPRIDGYEALAKLRAKNFGRPVIALTAHAMREERDRALAAGFNDHVPKPVNREHLIETIRNSTKSSN